MVLAEIADKMPTLGQCALFGLFLCPFAVLVMLLGRWLLVLPLLVSVAILQTLDLWDASFRAAYMNELGLTYLLGSIALTGSPALLSCCVTPRFERWFSVNLCQAEGLCLTCRHDLCARRPGDRCPECGTVVAPQAPPASKLNTN
jgi:hypothetical protein